MFSPQDVHNSDPPHDREGEWLTRPRTRPSSACSMSDSACLEHGYNGLGIQALLAAANTPPASSPLHGQARLRSAGDRPVHVGRTCRTRSVPGRYGTPVRRVQKLLRSDRTELPDRGYLGMPSRWPGPGTLGVQRGVSGQDRVVFHVHRRADRRTVLTKHGSRETSPRTRTPPRWPTCSSTAGKGPPCTVGCAEARPLRSMLDFYFASVRG